MAVRGAFQRQLRDLQSDVLELGNMVAKAIDRSIEALKTRDTEAARQIIADDHNIDHKRYDIEEQCLRLIATQQPMAGDLRTIITALHIVSELERMGDHAEGIAKINLMMGQQPLLKPLIDVPRMAQKAQDMLGRSLDAFLTKDMAAAKQIIEEDDEVDALYDQVYRELVTFMIEDPRTITRATHLLWVAHNLERIADRVTNICERVVFYATGKREDLEVSRY
jgi:phosphate transport system protein